MKQLNITFDDKDYELINNLKEKSKLGWREFLILMATHCNDAIKKGDLEFL